MKVEMFIVLNFEVFIVKWGRDIRWALANTTIKNSEGNLHIINSQGNGNNVVSRVTSKDRPQIHPM